MKILIAGGGTGGHLFPGIAMAQEFKRLAPEVNNQGKGGSAQILFVGTEKGIESSAVPAEGFEIKYISAEGFKGKGIFKKARAIYKIPIGIIQSIKILNSFRPDIVIGVGGYASGPVGIASLLLGYPLAIQEQNIFPGLTNRILGRFADLIFISFEETMKFFNGRRVCLTGNPIRRRIAEIGVRDVEMSLRDLTPMHRCEGEATSKACPERSEKDDIFGVKFKPLKFTLLIFGGSQGAHSINKAMMDGLKFLAKFKDSIFMIHQTGKADFEFVKKAYDGMGFESEVVPFIYNMADSYKKADLIICRAGATTLSEITSSGKTAILIPFPFAVNNHQEINAIALKEKGAAELIIEKDLNGEVLADKILSLMQDRTRLLELEIKSKKMGKPDAAKEIVEQCYRLVKNIQSTSAPVTRAPETNRSW